MAHDRRRGDRERGISRVGGSDRAGTIDSVLDKRTGLEILRPGEVGNELRAYREYPMHPLFGEGPWHLTPDGRFTSVTGFSSDGRRRDLAGRPADRIDGPFEESRRSQEIRLWTGIDRVELATELHDYRGTDRLFRVRFPAAIEGGRPVSEIGNGVIGRPFGDRTSTSPRSRSPSTIPPTTGSGSERRPVSTSTSQARTRPVCERHVPSASPRS